MLSPRGWAIIWVKALIRAWARIRGNSNLVNSFTNFFFYLFIHSNSAILYYQFYLIISDSGLLNLLNLFHHR